MSERLRNNYESEARGWRELAPDEEVGLGDRKHLWDARETYKNTGINGRLLARLAMGGARMDIYDLRYTESEEGVREITPKWRMEADYLVVDSYGHDKEKGFQGLSVGDSVVMGRQGNGDRFDYDNTVSRRHLEIRADNSGLVITNLRPSNATKIEWGELMSEDEKSEDRYLRESIAGYNDSASYTAPEEYDGNNGGYGDREKKFGQRITGIFKKRQ